MEKIYKIFNVSLQVFLFFSFKFYGILQAKIIANISYETSDFRVCPGLNSKARVPENTS